MCGIAGLISPAKPIPDALRAQVEKMTHILRHRGPDHTGFFLGKDCMLGNTRLRILDLSDRGDLPVCSADGKVRIAYNGEVTNFRELRETFALDKKYAFRSGGDTELVLHLYEELGIDFLRHLSGMFAMAIYDAGKRKVYLVRDQYGMRPLFYMFHGGQVFFSSEIKSFLELDCFRPEIDREAMFHYFSLIYIPGERTPFTQVKELDGGHLLEIDLNEGTRALKEYYRFDYSIDREMTLPQAVSGLREAMMDSMRRNLISDAPPGMTLSGGVDTSSMLGMAKAMDKSRELHTFSIKVNEPSFDESRYQRLMADYAGSVHHEITVNAEDVLGAMRASVACLDEPNGDGAVIPSYLLAQEASKFVRVLLSGEGGDELNNAYETHLAYKVRKLYRRLAPQAVRSLLRGLASCLPANYSKLSPDFLAKRFTEGVELDVPGSHFYWRHVFSDAQKEKLLGPQPYRPTSSLFREMFDALPYDDELNKISHLDFKYFFIGDLMVKNDRTFMAHSVEARFPFTDRLLVDFATKIPPWYRIRNFTGRYVEKEAMRPFLPDAICRRRGMGLEMPHSFWFLKGLGGLADQYLNPAVLKKAGIFNSDYVTRIWQEHKSGRRDYGRPLWSIINYLIWFELFIDKRNYKDFLK
ncbi:MAG: asparagine synthase (glutamine-hydrolyzing) [Elusimicrobia bacterium CG08_land_8_20_14_0_20_59_10]|nr:MAG: asparagine synthase (glutamine-hydrolyzing) [Elusimicrobia bacterium CG08_land_8_20_14_0_20_59_10]